MSDSPFIVEVTDDNFEQTVIAASHQTPVLVDFWAEWCQPCKAMLPVLHQLVEEYAGGFILGKLNIDEQKSLATEAGIRSVPTVLVFRKGVVADQFLGVQPESVIRGIIERNLFRESDALLTQAQEAVARGDEAGAVDLARQAVALDPDRAELQFELALYLIQAGAWDDAETTVNGLPRELRDSPDTEALRARIDLGRTLAEAPERAALETQVAQRPDASLPRYQLAATCLAAGEPEAALQHLLAIVRRDRGFRDDAARKAMLAVFAQLDPDDPLLQRYRNQMFNALH